MSQIKNFGTMTPEELREVSRKGGQARARKFRDSIPDDERPILERDLWFKCRKVILSMLGATIPGSREPDFLTQLKGVIALAVMFEPPVTLEALAAEWLHPDVRHRAGEAEAQREMVNAELRAAGALTLDEWNALRPSPQELMNALLRDAEHAADLRQGGPLRTSPLDPDT